MILRHLFLPFVAWIALRADEPYLPPEAVALLSEKEVTLATPKTGGGDIVSVESGGAPVNPVWRATSAEKRAKPDELAVNRKFSGAIAKDQVCLFVNKARCVESDAANGKAKLTAAEQNTNNYTAQALWKDVVTPGSGRRWSWIRARATNSPARCSKRRKPNN